jgi:hypothetical protein
LCLPFVTGGGTQRKENIVSSTNHAQPTHEEIALRAFQLWTQEGQPFGNGDRHWLQAEAEMKNGTRAGAVAQASRRAKRTPKAV